MVGSCLGAAAFLPPHYNRSFRSSATASEMLTGNTNGGSFGNFGDHKGVGKGVSELRIGFGPGYRVYYGLDGRNLVILLAGGTKRRQRRDIEKAQACWSAYREERRHARERIQN